MGRDGAACEPLLPPAADAAGAAGHRSLLADMWHSRMWRILPLMFLYVVGIAMVAPQVPGQWRSRQRRRDSPRGKSA